MKTYDSYKDSGIEWIGEIPNHWQIKKVKNFTQILTGSTPKSTDDSYWNGNINWVTTDDLGKLDSQEIFESRRKITEAGFQNSGTYLAPIDSIVLSTRAPIGHLGILKIEACTNQGCKTIVSNNNFDSRFLYYLLFAGKSYLISLGVGTTFLELPSQSLKDFYTPFPSKEEQSAIASYLDRKTAEIDELIADKKRLLELYEEEKTAVINQAITKGINPDTPMKDSGIDWLGEIPEHWEVKRLKYVSSINDEVLPEKTDENYEIKYVEISGVKSGLGIVEISDYQFKNAPSRARRIVKDGDVLVSTVRTYLKSVAKVDNPPTNLIASTGFAVIRPKEIDSDFIGYLFYSEPLIGEIISLSTGVSYPAINSSQIGDIKIPIPTLKEQKEIANYIKSKISVLDSSRSKTEKLIELLAEYRTAIISEVVTGKIKVVGQ